MVHLTPDLNPSKIFYPHGRGDTSELKKGLFDVAINMWSRFGDRLLGIPGIGDRYTAMTLALTMRRDER
jgi:hypothetical protein